MSKITISLGDIPVTGSETDEELKKKAELHLPKALKKLGEGIGEELWETMKKTFGRGPIKMDSSSGAKQKFIREKGQEFARGASLAEKRKITASIFEQLKDLRDKAKKQG